MSVQSVQRAFAVLDAVAHGALGVTEIAARTDLPKSTVARMLATLEQLGVVEQVEDGSDYGLGPRLAELIGPSGRQARLEAVVRPHLERLSMQLREATGFGVPGRQAVRVLTQVETSRAVLVRDYSGTDFPAHVGAPGIALMAEWPGHEVERYLTRPLRSYTSRTVVDPDQLRARLDQVREVGYSWVHDEFAEGISSVAAVVHDPEGRPVGAVYAHGPTYRFPAPGDGEWVGDLVRGAAGQITPELV